MTIGSYLNQVAFKAILRDQEKESIQRSIATLEGRLKDHFGTETKSQFVFGSYSRGTILPRGLDPQSDVDYMVVFSDDTLKPQSYLDRLRRFSEVRYGRSEVAQSRPTVVLELNHIRFELVPAIQNWWSGLQIPGQASGYQNWQDTDPKDFNDKLVSANQTHGSLIKPLVRIMKYWNASANYPFESYDLEQRVATHGYGIFGLLTSRQIGDYFYEAVNSLEAGWSSPQWKREAVTRLKTLVTLAQTQERLGNVIQAEATMQRLLPPIGATVAS